MKRTVLAMTAAILSTALGAAAQTYGAGGGQQTPPPAAATGQAAPAGQAPAAPATPATKRPRQAKTQPELDAYNAAAAIKETAALEKAADDFATKFPDSELRILLYQVTMRTYQTANTADKTEAMGRKVLSLDADDPEALCITAEFVVEGTHESDIDRDQRYDEAAKMAQKALVTVDTDISVPVGTPQERLDAYKSGLRSQAYSTLGGIAYGKNDFPTAQTNFQKAIDAFPSQPYPADVLRLAIALDKQEKYAEALKVANRAVELTQEGSQIGTLARRERDRLQQLNVGAAPATAPATAPKN